MTTLATNDLPEQGANRVITFNGTAVQVPTNVTDIGGFVKAENKRRGISTFTAYVNGQEVGAISELDTALTNGGTLEIKTYAKPGV